MIIKIAYYEIILKSQQNFKSKAHSVYTEEIKKIALSSNDNKRLQTFDKIISYPYGTKCWKNMQNRAARISKYKVINFDDVTNKNETEHNPKWPYIPDDPYKIIKTGGPGLRKTDALLKIINSQLHIGKIYLFEKDPYEAKYQYLFNKREKVGLKHYDNFKAFIEYSNDMKDVYKNIEERNQGKKRKVLIVFDEMIAVMVSNKKVNPTVTELFTRGRKLNISVVFITQSYVKVPKAVRLKTTHVIMKIPNKRELHQIAINHSSDIDFKNFMKIYKKCTAGKHSFSVNDTTLSSDDP